MKEESKVANSSKYRKDSLVTLLTLVLISQRLLTQMMIVTFQTLSTQMLIVTFDGILSNQEFMSKLVIQCAQSKKDFSSTN